MARTEFTRHEALMSLRPNVASYSAGVPTEQQISDELLRLQTMSDMDKKRRRKELIPREQDVDERMDDIEERLTNLERRMRN